MVVNVLVKGVFPTEMAEIQKDRGINFYEEDADLPQKEINVYLVNSPVVQLTAEDPIRILKMLGERKGFWANFSFASSNDYENSYNVKILDPVLGMYYEKYRYNLWDQLFSAELKYRNHSTFPFDLRTNGRPLQVETIDGKKLDIESIEIPKAFTRTSTSVTKESPFNLPIDFQVSADNLGKVGRELFYTEFYGQNIFYAKSVLKRRIELLKQPELTVEKIREFQLYNVDVRTLTEDSIHRIFSTLPSFTYETIGVMNDWFDQSKIGRIVRTMPAGLVLGTVGSVVDVCDERNVEYDTQAIATLGRRTGGYITQNRRKIQSPNLEKIKTDNHSSGGKIEIQRENVIPLSVYGEN